MAVVAFCYSGSRVPAIILYFAKELIVFHHPCATGLMMVEVNKAAVAKFIGPAWQMFGNDVGMDIYFHLSSNI